MIQVCGVLYNFLLELEDEGDQAEAAPDLDLPPEGAHGTQPQLGQEQGEFQNEKRLGEERRARIVTRFIEARRSQGLPLIPRRRRHESQGGQDD